MYLLLLQMLLKYMYSPMQNKGVFCCYCSGRDDGFGKIGGDFLAVFRLYIQKKQDPFSIYVIYGMMLFGIMTETNRYVF